MHTNPSYNLEKLLFTNAVDGLTIARDRGATDRTGLDALVAAMYVRRPRIYAERQMRDSPEIADYFKSLGLAVELAIELNETVDQQR